MKKSDNEILYEKIIENYYGTILVIDRDGKVIYVNDHVLSNTKDITKEEILSSTMYELVKKGYWLNSSSLEALIHKESVTKYIQGNIHSPLMTTSIPVFDQEGELELVIAYSQGMNYVDDMIKRIDYERNKVTSIINYTNSINEKTQFIAESESMKNIFSFLKTIAYSDSTILICGESGTGKEVIAKYIFHNSKRSNEIFLPINCAAFPPELIEAELFGYEKGSFTGANKEGKIGLFELTDHGTLFLDEIGELSLPLQSKLLRVLENKEIKRIGGNKIKLVDTRIIAATNKNLIEMVRNKTFREDLYYRLNVIPITVPPIKERKEDIFPLCNAFLNEFNVKYGQSKVFDLKVRGFLEDYDWPGNVREIKNVVERLFITSTSNVISSVEIPKMLFNSPRFYNPEQQALPMEDDILYEKPYKEALKEFEKRYIKNIMNKFDGNVSKVASHIKISRSDLYYKLGKIKEK